MSMPGATSLNSIKTDRKQLAKAIAAFGAGDVLLVTRLDRLDRSTRDLLNVLATVSEKSAGFRSIADAWADATTPHGRLMVTVLGGLAEFERELIRTTVGPTKGGSEPRPEGFGSGGSRS
jgi:DNA invertase Pin-like site-specific DNA recombinase